MSDNVNKHSNDSPGDASGLSHQSGDLLASNDVQSHSQGGDSAVDSKFGAADDILHYGFASTSMWASQKNEGPVYATFIGGSQLASDQNQIKANVPGNAAINV